jgi:hypothetical protein
MSICERCGAEFHCAMADAPPDRKPTGAADETPCWCTFEPPAVPVPSSTTGAAPAEAASASAAVACWCPACLRAHIASLKAPDAV